MILVIGRQGQLATSFKKLLPADTQFWGRAELPQPTMDHLKSRIDDLRPSLIINASAYTAVDLAEKNQVEATILNTTLVASLAECASLLNVPFIHFSTDYVYPGTGTNFWNEDDWVSPVNFYGFSKLAGEEAIRSYPKHFIFRTSWVYSETGTNFVKTILRLAAERETLKIVADQFGSPTFSDDIARMLTAKIPILVSQSKELSGTYNLAGAGVTHWHEFASAIVAEARHLGWQLKVKDIQSIPSSEFPTPARRPMNSRMNQDKISSKLGIVLPPWRESLVQCLKNIKASENKPLQRDSL